MTGSSGFIGRETVLALEAGGWQVLQTVRTSVPESGRRRSVELDLSRPESILALQNHTRCDAIVHLAARADWAAAPGALFRENVLSTAALVALAQVWKSHFVFASAALLDGVDPGPTVSSTNEYMRTKLMGESLVGAARVDAAILRVGGVFGLSGPEHLGLNVAIRDALHGIPPTLVGSGAAKRNYIYSEDVAATILDVLNRRLVGTYGVAGREELSIAEILESVCQILAPGLSLRREPGPEGGDQVFARSAELPEPRNLEQALKCIQERYAGRRVERSA